MVSPRSSATVREKPRTPRSRTSSSPPTPARSRPAPPAAPTASPSTTSCCASRKTSAKAPNMARISGRRPGGRTEFIPFPENVKEELMWDRFRDFWLPRLLFLLTLGSALALAGIVILAPWLAEENQPGLLALFAMDAIVRRTTLASAVGLVVTAFVFF